MYRPLDTAVDQFRLLKICRGLPTSSIVCNLNTIPLGNYSRHAEGVYCWNDGKTYEAEWQPSASELAGVQWVPKYEALSYTWGDANVKRSITVDGEPMQITTNLYDALEALRLPDADRLVWVDALCINQQDVPERNAQVKRMRSMYQRAQQTVLWLGKSDDESDRAMNILEKVIGTQAKFDDFQWPEPLFGWQGPCFDPAYAVSDKEEALFRAFYSYLHATSPMSLKDLDERDWQALETFFKNRYWNRIWVIQEIANSQKVQVRCGSRLMSFDTLRYLHSLTVKLGPLEYSKQDAISHERLTALISPAYAIVRQRGLARHPMRTFGMENLSTSFLDTIEKFRSFQSSDPRDKVYALLGLVTVDHNMPLPEPDYSKTVSEVYSETVRAIISHTADLGVLCMPNAFAGMVEYQMSSWIPDWTTKSSRKALNDSSYRATGNSLPQGPGINLQTSSKDHLRQMMNRGGKMQLVKGSTTPNTDRFIHRPVYKTQALSDPKVLRLNGFVIDSVSLCSKNIPERAFDGNYGEWKRSIVEWEKLLKAFRVFARRGDQVEEINPGFRHPKMPDFVLTLFRGLLFAHDELPQFNDTDDLDAVYLEHYLVWAGHISAAEAHVPISEVVLSAIFDFALKDNLKGWKVALTVRGRLALIPSHAAIQDRIVMLFGADVPMLLRPVVRLGGKSGKDEIIWVQIGTVFVHGIMNGEALDIFRKEKLKTQTFTLL